LSSCTTITDLQAEAALALADCSKFAKRKIESERQKRDTEAAQVYSQIYLKLKKSDF